jgi:uncharacterized protein (DUF2249 family)
MTSLAEAADVLDLRAVHPRRQRSMSVDRFRGLATGHSLQVLTGDNPLPLRLLFADRAGGEYGWTVLESGPAFWRVQITRVTDAGRRRARGEAVAGPALPAAAENARR